MNNFTDYYKQQTERDALIKRKASELQALRKMSSSTSSHNVSPIASPTTLLPPIAPCCRNGTLSTVSGGGPTFCTSVAPTPVESPLKVNNKSQVGVDINSVVETDGVREAKQLLLQAQIESNQKKRSAFITNYS